MTEDADRLAAALAETIGPRYLAAAADLVALFDEIEADERRIWRLNHQRDRRDWLLSAEMRARGITGFTGLATPLGRAVRLPSFDPADAVRNRFLWPRPEAPIDFASHFKRGA